MLRSYFVLSSILISCLAFAPARAQNKRNDQRLVNYAKNIDVSRLDPSLRRQSLDSWIASLIGNAPQQWKIEDCGTQVGVQNLDIDPPVCGKLYSRLADGRVLRVWIAIASHKTGTKAPPILWLAYFGFPGQELPATRLNHLPALVKGVVGGQRIS